MIDSHDNQIALAKIAFVGPPGSGKAETLHQLLNRIPADYQGELTQIDSHGDTLLSVEVFPANLPPVAGRSLQLQLVAVTGVVASEATMLRLLEDADGIVFVADSRVGAMSENVRIAGEVVDALRDLGMEWGDIPVIVQQNHQDGKRLYTEEEVIAKLDPPGGRSIKTVAKHGQGLFLVLKSATDALLSGVTSQVMVLSPGQQSASIRQSDLDDAVTFTPSAASEQEGGMSGKAVFSFPATKRTLDHEGPFNTPSDTDTEDDKGGLWRRLAKPFGKKSDA